jgi:hypothetical protein
MPRPIRSIEIYLPLDYNDGRPIAESKYVSVQQELLNRFGGVTSVQRRFPLQGLWRSGSDTYHDRVVVLSVMDFGGATPPLPGKAQGPTQKKFDQLEILITVGDLLAI